MALAPGVRVGPYIVTARIGAGGMGEVYRARDSKLNRDVAIKVLPDLFAGDGERLARFEREAQVLASLNHPNIAHVHGLEDSGETRAIVMELVEGEDLAQRLARGPLSLPDALSIAKQTAEALEAAHELGIVHRDLKPANIKVRDDGTVKVLDFGLAKAVDPGVPSAGNVTDSPTLTFHATQAGVILGTAAYMAPEQAAGRPVDRRADIWSFGVVLWEMLVGRSLFADGETVSHVLADVLRAPVDFDAVPAGPLRQLVRRCLDRNVKTRLRDIGEARVVLAQPSVAQPAEAAQLTTSSPTTWALATALVVVSVVAAWSWLRPGPLPQQRSIVRFTDTAAVASGLYCLKQYWYCSAPYGADGDDR